jgi:hypothetical protein
MALEPGARNARLERWTSAPRLAPRHPREEHLIPLMVASGRGRQRRGAGGVQTTPSPASGCPPINFGT